jgi:hypothetical protein
MTTSIKVLLTAVAAVVIGAAIWGGYLYPKSSPSAGSAVGSTFGDAKVAMVNMAPATSAASSTSILNTDGSTRFVESLEADCTGVATAGTSVATMTITGATTTVANEGLQGNTNTFSGTIATTTAFSLLSSVIASTGSAVAYVWPANTYLTFLFNTTNTASCVVGVHYLAS